MAEATFRAFSAVCTNKVTPTASKCKCTIPTDLQPPFPPHTGMQVLAGDVRMAEETFWTFFSVWQRFGLPPERYMFTQQALHPTEHRYPLRPELIESASYLYQVRMFV